MSWGLQLLAHATARMDACKHVHGYLSATWHRAAPVCSMQQGPHGHDTA